MEVCTDIQRSFFICCTSQRNFAKPSGVKWFLDSGMRSARSLPMRTSLRMKEGGAGIAVYNYSRGIITEGE